MCLFWQHNAHARDVTILYMSCPNLAAWNALHRARLPCTPSGTTALPTHPPARPAASRPAPEFIAQDDRYKVQARSYEAQYNNVYLRRAEELLADMTARAKAHWQDVQDGTTPVAAKIIDLREGQRLCIVGTVYKDSRLKPNVLHEFENERCVMAGGRLERVHWRTRTHCPPHTLPAFPHQIGWSWPTEAPCKLLRSG